MSSLHDPETNKVTLAGYYDNVPELSADEKAELEATMGVDDAAESSRLGVGAMGGFEFSTGIQSNSSLPEDDAAFLRSVVDPEDVCDGARDGQSHGQGGDTPE